MNQTSRLPHATALSVNVNKVALVRNTRHLGIPSVTRAAELCLQAGAQGITVHPRPDERHIRSQDVFELATLMKAWPDREYNIEGNPFHNLMGFVRAVRPHQVTFVPDSEGQFTSDHGWSFPQDAERLRPLIAEAHALGVRVSLFMDAEPEQMAGARAVGADRVELYTEPYAAAWHTPQRAEQLARFRAAGQAALVQLAEFHNFLVRTGNHVFFFWRCQQIVRRERQTTASAFAEAQLVQRCLQIAHFFTPLASL